MPNSLIYNKEPAPTVSYDELKKTQDIASSGLSGDELEQVRELLFGGIIRDIKRQRDELQKDVSIGFAEADQMTNRRLDDVMRRLDTINQQLERDREDQRLRAEAEAHKINSSLIKLASEQASTLAQETQRLDALIEAEPQRVDAQIQAETHRVDALMEAETHRVDTLMEAETQRIDALIAAETQRIHEALAAQSKRIDDALDALYQKMEADKMQHINALKQSLNTERNRLTQSIKALADTINRENNEG